MTLRDYFAAKAMQGLLTTGEDYTDAESPDGGWEWFATASYKMAEAMLKERENIK